MSFDFVEKVMCIGGNGTEEPIFQFYKRGFNLGGSSPSWQDIVLSGNGSLSLTAALADGLNYLNLFDGTLNTDYDYENLETEGSFSFVSGTTYTIQVKSGSAAFSRSQEGGIVVGDGNEFNFTADGSPVYIKTNGYCSLSII